MFSDIGAGFKSMVGGEIKSMSKLTRDTRNELIAEAQEEAVGKVQIFWECHKFEKDLPIYLDLLYKGQLISECLFGVLNFSQKMNENKSTRGILVVKSIFFFCFFARIEDIKKSFWN